MRAAKSPAGPAPTTSTVGFFAFVGGAAASTPVASPPLKRGGTEASPLPGAGVRAFWRRAGGKAVGSGGNAITEPGAERRAVGRAKLAST